MNIIGKKYWYLIFSAIIIIPGLASLFLYGLNLSIEFTGGSRLTLVFEKNVSNEQLSGIKKVFEDNNIKVSSLEKSEKTVFVKTAPLDQKKDAEDGLSCGRHAGGTPDP